MTTNFDKWLTTQPEPLEGDWDEYDPPCRTCGLPCSDHVPVVMNDGEYEATVCPPNTNTLLPDSLSGDTTTAKEGS